MKKSARLFSALLVVLSFAAPPASAELDVSTLFDAVVTVNTGGSQGAGVFVSGTRLITAAHVVGDSESVILKGNAPNNFEATGTVVFVDTGSDLAVIESSENSPVFLEIATLTPKPSEVVYAAGSPISATVVSRGKWIGIERIDGRNQQVIEIPVDHGNSGGPLVNESTQVVGIILAKSTINPSAYAATLDQISDALSEQNSVAENVVEFVKDDFPILLPVFSILLFLGLVLGIKFQKNRIKTIKLEI